MREFPPSWWLRLERVLRFDEGVRYLPYDCGTGKTVRAPVGRITIGVGRNLENKGISEDVVRLMLKEDMEDALHGARNVIGAELFDSLTDARQHAIMAMVFQLGAMGFAKFENTIAAIRERDFKTAAEHAKASHWAKQTPERAARVLAMLSDEKYVYPS